MRYFITYGDSGYELAKKRICSQAAAVGEFDHIIAYGREDLSLEVIHSPLLQIKRGGGLWCWKPDVILTTLEKMQEGDCLVYCDAGCTLQKSGEWNRYWSLLQSHEMIASRIFQRTNHWTRRELLEYMHSTNHHGWEKCFQYMATIIIIKKTAFTVQFVQEWRSLILENPQLIMDVPESERHLQHAEFVESRHDQSVYSALVYKYQNQKETRCRIYAMWEHMEDYDLFSRQAIRTTRLRTGETRHSRRYEVKAIIKRILKDFIYKPLWIVPQQWYYERQAPN